VNRWLGARRSLLGAARPYLDRARPRLLDVGCGSADLAALMVRAAPALFAVGVDLKLLHVKQAPACVRTVVADVRQLPFPPLSFDVVTACLFLHHFDARQLAPVLRSLWQLAGRALIVSDLQRARVPYVFGRAAFGWLFRSRVSVQDGLISIRRGFTCDELRQAFREAGLPLRRLERRFPYRLLAVAER
jgi:SAM-dependent methyltransferase